MKTMINDERLVAVLNGKPEDLPEGMAALVGEWRRVATLEDKLSVDLENLRERRSRALGAKEMLETLILRECGEAGKSEKRPSAEAEKSGER